MEKISWVKMAVAALGCVVPFYCHFLISLHLAKRALPWAHLLQHPPLYQPLCLLLSSFSLGNYFRDIVSLNWRLSNCVSQCGWTQSKDNNTGVRFPDSLCLLHFRLSLEFIICEQCKPVARAHVKHDTKRWQKCDACSIVVPAGGWMGVRNVDAASFECQKDKLYCKLMVPSGVKSLKASSALLV